MKKLIWGLALALAISSLAACAAPAESGSAGSGAASLPAQSAAASSEAASQPAEEPGSEASGPATVSVAYADEALLAQPDTYDAYADEATDYQVQLVFSTDTAVQAFRFLKLSFVDVDEAGAMTFETEDLYTVPALTPERPVVITMTFAGAIPDRGIAYQDADGSEHYFTIELSGESDAPMLVPFEP